MTFRKDFLFVVVGAALLSQINPVEAAEIRKTLPLEEISEQYNFQNDPFLVDWTFTFEDTEKQPTVPVNEMSKDDKILARWKEKQAKLWESLPVGPFVVNASAYTAAADECGKSDGITASGIKVTENRTLACPPAFPFGTKIAIEGMGTYRCEDRGGAIKINKVDIYMETKQEAFSFGRRNLIAEVVK